MRYPIISYTKLQYKGSFVRLLVVGGSLLVVVSLSRSVYALWHKRDYVYKRADSLKAVQAENAQLKQQVEVAQKPEFIEKEAREKLGMTKEGETIVIMPKSQYPISNIQLQAESEKLPNWKKWWRLFF